MELLNLYYYKVKTDNGKNALILAFEKLDLPRAVFERMKDDCGFIEDSLTEMSLFSFTVECFNNPLYEVFCRVYKSKDQAPLLNVYKIKEQQTFNSFFK
ncbi:hypothetical protein [Arcicella lustrica]|uniref:Uncharacterized protein n=1 Tax=Arcicella lustrica TaxID=2984196 RepID=A0ABU5SIG4_9BACT|nr:hypothetical protein [Arcicella sp. DC25W]MEA5426819.1 hypothetical protein [Arcicella sp. DC25W]